ncbi:Cell surface receptor IPT/TIG domain protein, partial [Candidatus Magnetomorum sp. HK-1]
TLSLKDLKDDIATATTAAGTFTLNAVIPEDPEITSLNPTNGEEAGGTVVTITGSNFIVGTAATVMFGTNEATEVNVASATSISCKSPAGTGTVNVTVTQDSRTSNAVQFTYDPPSTNEMTLKAGDVSGDPEDEVIIPINISDISAAFDSDAFGFTLKYDSNVLSFVSVEKTGTLVEPFTMVNGSENTPGEVKVSGAYFGAKASIDNGLFVNIKVQVKADASTNTSLVLTELKDDIADATTSAGTFTVNVIVQDPVISSIDPTNGAEAGDTIVTITGSNFIVGTAATVMFGANEATEVNVVSTTEISCKSPAGTGTVDVTVTQDSRTSNAVQFTYNPVVSEMTLKAGDVSGDPEDEVIIPIF